MTTAPAPNNRASLLAGLRTGGVRSSSGTVPHTAAPSGSFNVPRFASQYHPSGVFDEDEEDRMTELNAQAVFANYHGANRTMPMTAAVDGPNNRFTQQQQQPPRGMNPNSAPFSPAFLSQSNVQTNIQQTQAALQMQMMQLEIMRLQAVQTQQYQADLLAQTQRQMQNRRSSFNPPATAGPLNSSFDLRSATLSAQLRRANQADLTNSQPGIGGDEQVPMTAAIGGKFGSRTASMNASPMGRFAPMENNQDMVPPSTPNSTTVISGGTSLGSPAFNNVTFNNTPPSKSESSTSWRRGGNNNSVLSGNNRAMASPSVKVTPPPGEQRASPPLVSSPTAGRARPQPLHFSLAAQQPLPAVAIDTSEADNDDGYSSSSDKSAGTNSSPTTPRSSSSNETPLSPREEASKKLYEGLGIGRPASAVADRQAFQQLPSAVSHRMVSQPTRQPRGPPSGADELGPKNFATRIRRKAIGGLGMLMGARERREFVEAY